MHAADSVLADIEAQAAREFLPIPGKEQSAFLEWLVRERRPRVAADVGSLIGYSTILIARNLRESGEVTGIEIADGLARRAAANVALAGLSSKARIVRADAADALGTLRGIDLLFLDAGRSQFLHHLKRAEPLLAPGAIVVANGTGAHARFLTNYLAHVREGGRYESTRHDFGGDAMEVSRFLG